MSHVYADKIESQTQGTIPNVPQGRVLSKNQHSLHRQEASSTVQLMMNNVTKKVTPGFFSSLFNTIRRWKFTSAPNANMNSEQYRDFKFSKHGDEYPDIDTAEEFEDSAEKKTFSPSDDVNIRKRQDDSYTLYDKKENDLIVADPKGDTITRFRPKKGEDYKGLKTGNPIDNESFLKDVKKNRNE